MGGDLATLAGELSPYVTTAIGAYGGAVLARAQEDAADATVRLGRRFLQRIFGIKEAGEPLPEVVAELIDDPNNSDLQAVLRVQIGKLLAQDAVMATEIRALLAQANPAVTTITASGERSVAAHTITGGVYTGDGHRPGA